MRYREIERCRSEHVGKKERSEIKLKKDKSNKKNYIQMLDATRDASEESFCVSECVDARD